MSTISHPGHLRLAAARPTHPARRALLALAEALARIALHRPDPRDDAFRDDAQERRERDGLRLLAQTAPLR